MKDNHLIDTDPTDATRLHKQPRTKRRRAVGDTLTRLLSCKPLDVELRRLQRAAARSKARLKNKRAK